MKTLDKLREQVECLYLGKQIERFSYDLEMKTREQNRNRWSFFTFIYNRSSKMNYFSDTSLWRHAATRLASRTMRSPY